MGEAVKNPDSRSEPPRLRRVHLPGTVPRIPASLTPRPGDDEERQDASEPGAYADTDTDTAPGVVA
ncbi:hypothetical protein ACGH7X_40405 [Streptomyces sp. BBFR51]|uniref:hypothetical protein n=1 Tax=Streptomyces sp. BBFR51 TaxID=3372856 RepID=UPI0037DBFB1A